MTVEWTPFRWPVAWTDPSALSLLRGTAINYLLIENGAQLERVRSQARQDGFQVADPAKLPAGITLVKGSWAGVRRPVSRRDTGAGPTGVAHGDRQVTEACRRSTRRSWSRWRGARPCLTSAASGRGRTRRRTLGDTRRTPLHGRAAPVQAICPA